jgi:hypothetical protein
MRVGRGRHETAGARHGEPVGAERAAVLRSGDKVEYLGRMLAALFAPLGKICPESLRRDGVENLESGALR